MHATHSYTMARLFDELYKIADIIHCSHENWNGESYPNGLKGEQIPIEARIIHVVSDYVSLTMPTVIGGYFTKEAAKQRISESAGIAYDPKLAARFLEFLEKKNY